MKLFKEFKAGQLYNRMKGLVIGGLITLATSMKIKKGYINPTPNPVYYNQMAPSSSMYYGNPYAQMPIYYPQTASQLYPQQIPATQSYPIMTNAITQIPTSPSTVASSNIKQMLQPAQPQLAYPFQGTTSYSPNFLSFQPSVMPGNTMYSPSIQQYYTTPDGSQLFSPQAPTYYQTNDASPLDSSLFDYFQ